MFVNFFDKIKDIVVGKNKNKNKKKGGAPVVNIKTTKPKVEVKELKETIGSRPMKLRFSPTAWAKFLFMRDIGDTEVGGFAITMPDDLLYVDDFVLPKQECGGAHVDFDDESVADLVDDMVDEGLKPAQFLRIWIHTHPSMSASPSITDEKTFERVWGGCDWAIMAIISTNGDQYCELRVNGGPLPGSFEIPIEVDYESYDFPASDSEAWEKEYKEKVEKVQYSYSGYAGPGYHGYHGYGADDDWHGYPNYARTIAHFRNPNAEPVGFKPSADGKKDDTELRVVGGYNKDEAKIVSVKTPLCIPDEILQYITPNQMGLLEDMSPYEREYVLDEIRERFKLGD
jgi:proteasome lid subunit RPN8/RPN11